MLCLWSSVFIHHLLQGQAEKNSKEKNMDELLWLIYHSEPPAQHMHTVRIDLIIGAISNMNVHN